MTIIELKDQIVKNNLSNFYIFTGYELGIMNIYLEQMSNKIGLPITRADSVLSIYGRLSGGSLFGDSEGFYVIRNDTDFPKNDKAFPELKNTIGKNTVVLLYEKIDSRLKFGKFFKDDIVAFEKLTPTILKSYIKQRISLSDKNIETLMNICNGSYDMCMLEIDKIKQYQKSWLKDPGCDKAFSWLLECGVIYQSQESDIWKFTEAVCSHKVLDAFCIADSLLSDGASSITLLGTLYNSLKSVMLIQCCSGGNIAEITGLDKGQIYFNKKYTGIYGTLHLVESVKLLSNIIDDIKSGKIDDLYATKYALVNIL